MGKQSCSSILVLLLLLHLVETNTSHSVVKFLPGFDGPLPFHLETGYVGVGESQDVQLFYYFIKSERDPEKDPLLFWLTGGPGCSGISGLLFEIGPINFKREFDGILPTLVSTPHSWTKVASIIFLDSPAATGFSYSRTKDGVPSSDWKQVHQAYEFIRKWLMDHKEFVSNPLYISGDSYSGITVPPLVQLISNENEKGIKPLLNLQGFVLGNPVTDGKFDDIYKFPFSHGMGLISDELYQALKTTCGKDFENVEPSNTKCLNNILDYKKCVSTLWEGHILEPYCEGEIIPMPRMMKFGHPRYLQELLNSNITSLPPIKCRNFLYMLAILWANDERVQKALHIRKGSIGFWNRCHYTDILPYTKDILSSYPYHVNLSTKGYRSLIYSGDHDLAITFLGTQAWIRTLNISILDEWRPWFINFQVAGYTRTYSNGMTYTTIKDGGHTAEYTPAQCAVMFRRWIDGERL